MKTNFRETEELDHFIVECFYANDYSSPENKSVYQKILTLWKSADDVKDFIDSVMNSHDVEILRSQGYGELVKHHGDAKTAIKKMFSRMINDKSLNPQYATTLSDAGSMSIAFGDVASLQISNGYGDGETKVVVFDDLDEPFSNNTFNDDLFPRLSEVFSISKGTKATIAAYDCWPFARQTDIVLQPGRYFAYAADGYVFIERFSADPL